MWNYSVEFKIPQFAGRLFRIRSRSTDWRSDVVARMAVIEVKTNGVWVDFITIREDDLSTLRGI